MKKKIYYLPKLDYEFNELEPFIDKKTMELHYEKHHRNYFNNLNMSLEKYPNLKDDLRTMLKKPILIPEDIKTSIQNNGGGYLNHIFFWKILKKRDSENKPSQKLKQLININFQSLENFKDKFSKEAQKLFGSGWVWLISDLQNKLKIISTKNQDTVLNIGNPIIGLDVWEHAYYLSYQNRRIDYIEAFFNIINWIQASQNIEKPFFENIEISKEV
ncbi:MAG: superoxide dismutase [Candidatus Phytoplasma cynodontis]|uniref:superoxide dismutase n=1 Tax='Cynodon dactylon' phytoplasma TaxID=295320 RepID=UPI001265D6AF|nr:superoxide dismutase ['Cynodon dactylon' phytoplasma]KAB8122010.1 superoxide dismutase ['Cynodon dactylon' phytoplasma]WIA07574.1 MAG: superoxide dismutase [Candidatus Phytoplasma cynodontis]